MGEEHAIQELKRMKRNGFVFGLIIIFLGLFSFIGLISVFPPSEAYFLFVGLLSLSIIVAGIAYLIYVGDMSRYLLRGVDAIKRIEPDEIIITKKFVLGKKGDIYLLAKRTSYMLALLRFNDLIETNEKKIRVKFPKTQFAKSKNIAGVKVFYSRGHYTIPVSQDKYASGDAVMYSLDTIKVIPEIFVAPIEITQDYKKEALLAIMDELEKEII